MIEPVTPWSQPPAASLPARMSAGDARAWAVQTALPAGSVLFYVLTGVVNRVPTRFWIGGNGAATTTGDATTYAGTPVSDTGAASFDVTSAVSAAWQPGRYTWVLLAIDTSGNRTQLAEGELRIDPDPNGATPADPRTYNERCLAMVRAVLLDRNSDDVQMYKINNREVTKRTDKELLVMEGMYESRVRRERIARGERVPTSTVGITFGGR